MSAVSTQDWIAVALVAAAAVIIFLSARRVAHRDRLQEHELWQQEIAGLSMPTYDGATYDWPETGLSRYLAATDDTSYDLEPVPDPPARTVPDSTISGPLPVHEPPPAAPPWLDVELSMAEVGDDADAFIAAMKADTQAFIARIKQ